MFIPAQHVCTIQIHADLTDCLKRMDALGLTIPATHVDHAIALIGEQHHPNARTVDDGLLSNALLVDA